MGKIYTILLIELGEINWFKVNYNWCKYCPYEITTSSLNDIKVNLQSKYTTRIQNKIGLINSHFLYLMANASLGLMYYGIQGD